MRIDYRILAGAVMAAVAAFLVYTQLTEAERLDSYLVAARDLRYGAEVRDGDFRPAAMRLGEEQADQAWPPSALETIRGAYLQYDLSAGQIPGRNAFARAEPVRDDEVAWAIPIGDAQVPGSINTSDCLRIEAVTEAGSTLLLDRVRVIAAGRSDDGELEDLILAVPRDLARTNRLSVARFGSAFSFFLYPPGCPPDGTETAGSLQ